PGVQITEYPALILIEGEDRLEFDMQEISDALGREMDPYFFQVQMTTHYGRLVLQDDRLLLFAKPEDAMEYTGLQLLEAETGKTEKQG
ncbi:MAG: MmoB/DmpM family protein, partial [Ktedonobacteraceae bacterium]|nr:MmoB/DmpM family protein [Ktedonobacteraceae bacterium]